MKFEVLLRNNPPIAANAATLGQNTNREHIRPDNGNAQIRNLSTTLRHRRFLFTDSFLLLWKWRVG